MSALRIISRLKIFRNGIKQINFRRIDCKNIYFVTKLINNSLNKTVPMVTNLNNSFVGKKCLSSESDELVDQITYEKVCDETLESLCDYFEELIEESTHLEDADVAYGSGVLTINLGEPYGTYVINRQVPNRQIWLSSPISGPKRYDFDLNRKFWIYKHDNVSLHQLLQEEIGNILNIEVDFSKCAFSLLIK